MKKQSLLLLGLCLALALSGCTVRTYPLTRDRVDQDLASGNRGYLAGQPPTEAEMERATTRTTQVFEIELGRKVNVPSTKTCAPQTTEPTFVSESVSAETIAPEAAPCGTFEKYTVQKNDTLQKISQKFYGTTKNWYKIYKANQDVLKTPNKVYPGQVINIPSEGLKAPAGNLK